MNSFVFIPARIDSSRLFQKMIKRFPDNTTVIGRTVENAKLSLIDVHLIADSLLITECANILNRNKHIEKTGKSGTDRISYFLRNNGKHFKDSDLGIVVLGDQPEIDHNLIKFVNEKYKENYLNFDGITVHIKKTNRENFLGTNNCKMVLGKDNQVFYISRSPVPGFKDKKDVLTAECTHYQHVSIVALKIEWLRKYSELDHFESSRESNEWLPLILNGCKIKSFELDNKRFTHARDVNTYEDWEFYEKQYM